MAEAGADLIEIGIPFLIRSPKGRSSKRRISALWPGGTTTDGIFEMVARVRTASQVPLALMTYMNPVYTYGVERFMTRCQEVGIDVLIVPDVPYEEKAELAGEARRMCGPDLHGGPDFPGTGKDDRC